MFIVQVERYVLLYPFMSGCEILGRDDAEIVRHGVAVGSYARNLGDADDQAAFCAVVWMTSTPFWNLMP
jgi:hypothetical protein